MGGGNRLARVGRAVAVALVAGLVVALPAYATAPNNDNFAAAQAITGMSGSVTGTNVEATKEAGEPNHAGNAGGKSVWETARAIPGRSGTVTGTNVKATKEGGEPPHAGNAGGKPVWYSWTAPASGPVTINTAGSNFDTLLGVYRGTSVSALTLDGSNDDYAGPGGPSQVGFSATSGTTYMVAVDGFSGASGNLSLSWSLNSPVTPANDMFANAQAIGGSSGSATGSNVGATKEAGEPSHAGNPGGASVWYSWTAPSAGQPTIQTAGSEFHTLLGGYPGSHGSAPA